MSDACVVYPTQKVIDCGICGGTDSVRWFCKNCAGSLCDTCKETHRTAALFRTHLVISRTQAVVRTHGPAKIAKECPSHKGKELSAYCKACDDACCIQCLADYHKNHDFCPIDEAYLNAEKRLNSYINELDDFVKSELEQLTTNTESEIETHEKKISEVKTKANAFRQELKGAVDDSCDALIDSLEKPNTIRKSFLLEIEKQKQNVDHLTNECTEKIREGNLDIITYNPPKPSSLIPIRQKSSDLVPEFVPGRELIGIIKDGVGKIEYREVKREVQCKEPSHTAHNFETGKFQVQKVGSFESKIGVTAMATAGKNRVWVAYEYEDTMYLYESGGKVLRSVTVKKKVSINDMAVKRSGEVIVTNTDQKVRMVNAKGKVTTLINAAPFDAFGVCLTEMEEIVVCMAGQGDKNHLAVYSPDGRRKVSEVRGRGADNKNLITDPYRVVQIGQDFCVVNGDENVVSVDRTGRVRWVYEGRTAYLGRDWDPSGICCDKYQHVFVTDQYNDCVHCLDREGQFIQLILTEKQVGWVYHWGIAVDRETGQVWVGNLGGNVVIASYQKSE